MNPLKCSDAIYTAADMPKCLRDSTAVSNITGISNTMMRTSDASGGELMLDTAVVMQIQGRDSRKRAMASDASRSDPTPLLCSDCCEFET